MKWLSVSGRGGGGSHTLQCLDMAWQMKKDERPHFEGMIWENNIIEHENAIEVSLKGHFNYREGIV